MIRRLRSRDPRRWTFRALAVRYELHVKTVWDIVTRKRECPDPDMKNGAHAHYTLCRGDKASL